MVLQTTDLSTLVLYTPATLATLSLEVLPPGLVGVMKCGVDQLQLVKVSGMISVLFAC